MAYQEFQNVDSSTTSDQPQPAIPSASAEIQQQNNIQRTQVVPVGPPPYTENVRIQPRLMQTPSLNRFHGRAQRTKKMGNFLFFFYRI